MKFQQWPKRDPDKNYFKVPNEVFHIGLSYPEISIYCYLLSIEDRETYQCYPSYKTIGKALGMSENTVSKYVRSLEEKGLIRTEPTMVRSKDGGPSTGICSTPSVRSRRQSNCSTSGSSDSWRRMPPVRGRRNASKNWPVKAPRTPCVRLSARKRVPVPTRGWRPNLARFRRKSQGRKKKQDKRRGRERPRQKHLCPQCGQLRGLLRGLEMGSKSGP